MTGYRRVLCTHHTPTAPNIISIIPPTNPIPETNPPALTGPSLNFLAFSQLLGVLVLNWGRAHKKGHKHRQVWDAQIKTLGPDNQHM